MDDAQRKFDWEMLTRKIDQEREMYDRETKRLAATEYARMVAAQDSHQVQYAKEYGITAVRSLFLLNGLCPCFNAIAFAGNAISKGIKFTSIGWSVTFFLIGLVFSVVAMAISFWNFSRASQINADFGALANSIIALKDDWPSNSDEDALSDMRKSYNSVVGACLLSLICFGVGCGLASAIISGAHL